MENLSTISWRSSRSGRVDFKKWCKTFHKLKGPPTRWWMMVTTCSVKTAGSPCRLQRCRDEDVYVADLHVGETHVRVSVMMLPALRGSDGKSHVSCYMHESVCFSRFRFRPSDAQSQDGLPQYEQPDGAMLGTPACRLWHFESRCMFRGCGWPWLERPGFSGVRGQLGRLLKDGKPSSEWVGAAMCFRSCAPKVVTSGVEN